MNFIINKEEFLKVKAAWITIPNRNATDHIFYNALRGHDLKRGFAPTTSERKLTQSGQLPWISFLRAKQDAGWLIRIEPTYAHDSPTRKLLREEHAKERINALSKKFGTEFSPELTAALRELFKGDAA